MCSLIVLVGHDPQRPILAAANRDEERTRPSAPPGLFVGERRRILSPRDRRSGGTWIGVDDGGRFAALTNLVDQPHLDDAPTRGRLVHLALDTVDGVDAAVEAVEDAVAEGRDNAFQLLVTDGVRSRIVVHETGAGRTGLVHHDFEGAPHAVTVSNEHRPGELDLGPLLAPALEPSTTWAQRLDALEPLLRHRGRDSADPSLRDADAGGLGHRLLKTGNPVYGTVSGSLVAVSRADPRALEWRFAAGVPGEVPWRNYGNLGRRLLSDA